MHLSFVTSNILHQVLSQEINIVYAPHNHIFDRILYHLPYNFFVFDEKYQSKEDNCIGLPDSHRDLYGYDLCIHNDIVSATQTNINRVLHTNMLIFEHRPRHMRLKKEDMAILNHKLSKFTKIFFDEVYANTWNQDKSIVINYGIPTTILTKHLEFNDRKSILIYTDTNTMLKQQVRSHLLQTYPDCGELSLDDLSLKEISKKLNNYKLLLNLSSNKLLTLGAVSCGCHVLTLDQHHAKIPSVRYESSVPEAINAIPALLTMSTEHNIVKEYISSFYNFDLFQTKLHDVIHTASKREAFVL